MHIVWLKLLTNLMLFAVAVLVVASCLGEDGVRNVFVLSWLSSAKTVEEGARKGPNIN
jgi:hypothetical protein